MGNWFSSPKEDTSTQTENEELNIPDFQLYKDNKTWAWTDSPIADALNSKKELTYEHHPTVRPIPKDWPWPDSPAFYVVL